MSTVAQSPDRFEISEVRDIFLKDIDMIAVETSLHLVHLLGDPGAEEAMAEAVRHAHTLKGLAGLVHAHGLRKWGRDLEALLASASGWRETQPDRACRLFQSVLDEVDIWHRMNRATVDENFGVAEAYYEEARARLAVHWAAELPVDPEKRETLSDPAPPQLPDVQPPVLQRISVTEPRKTDDVAAILIEPVPPPLQRREAAPAAEPPPAPVAAETCLPELAAPPLRRRAKKSAAEPAPAQPSPAEDPELITMVRAELTGYLGELPANLHQLAIQLDSEDRWSITRRLFHTMKGTAATFQIDALSSPAKIAETHCIAAMEDPAKRTREAFLACIEQARTIATQLDASFFCEALTSLASLVPETADAENAAEESSVNAEMVGYFIDDATENAAFIEQAILRWERGEEPASQIAALQRAFHTLKGAANTSGLRALGASVHHAEDCFVAIGEGRAEARREVFTFLLMGVDQLRQHLNVLAGNPNATWHHDWKTALESLLANEPISTPVAVAAPVQMPAPAEVVEDEAQTLRVGAGRLHELLKLVGELLTDRLRMERKVGHLRQMQASLRERNTALAGSIGAFQQEFEFNRLGKRGSGTAGPASPVTDVLTDEFSELEFDRYDQFSILARSLTEVGHDIDELSGEFGDWLEAFDGDHAQFTRTSRQLQEKVVSLSLVPLASLYPRLERAFRDAAETENKDASLLFEGHSALVDKTVVDRVFPSLLHLVRNAVSHGIENPDDRELANKSRRGEVRLSTVQLSNQIVVAIHDDGAGFQLERIRQRAIEKDWLPADAPPLDVEKALEFLFQPGFSTASEITSISGRGVGLDVVRTEIQAIGGAIEVHSEAGVGTTWTLRLPVSLSISEAIFATCGGQQFAFPLNHVESGLIIDADALRMESGRESYALGDQLLPVFRVAPLLDLPAASESVYGLIVNAGETRAVLALDRVLARREMVVKELDEFTALHPLLTGATLDEEGRVIPILNIPGLLKVAEKLPALSAENHGPATAPARSAETPVRVLIVDDSVSVRKVQERLLTGLGCEVTAATDGLHALEKLREGRFDLILTDLEMPQLNGYELISEIRGNPQWSATPIVVISSRGADKYINKAMHLGARSFLSKPFTEEQLANVLRSFAGWSVPRELPSAA